MSSSRRCALAALVTTGMLVVVLGSPPLVEAARDSGMRTRRLLFTLTRVPSWDLPPSGVPVWGDLVTNIVLRIAVLLAAVGLLAALAGRARSRAAAWLGGWGAAVLASTAASVASALHWHHVVSEGRLAAPSYMDLLVSAETRGAGFGVLTGWTVGLAVALACRPTPVAPAGAGAAPPPVRAGTSPPSGAPRIVEPPPPWWAPTATGGSFRPGPTAYPPGGLRSDVPDATYEMSTASGDPHPSDPDGTPAAGPGDPTQVAEARWRGADEGGAGEGAADEEPDDD